MKIKMKMKTTTMQEEACSRKGCRKYARLCRHGGDGPPPSFVKMVCESMEGTYPNGSMQIPVKFVKKHLLDFRKDTEMYLEGPRARTWPMILSGHKGGNVCLKRGWRPFALENNLKAGDILVFRLMSKNHFSVQIFGKDGIEKLEANAEDNARNMESSSSDDDDDDADADADYDVDADVDSNAAAVADDDDDYDDEVAVITKCRKKKVTLGDDLKRHNMMPILSSNNGDGVKIEGIQQSKIYVTEVYYSQRRPVSQAEKERAVEASKSCQTNNHPSVRKIMMPSHVYRGFWLSFPLDFARAHLPSETQAITLSDDSSTTEWKGKWLGSRRNPGLSGGWRKFSLDHRLEEGDVCIFELVNKNKVHFKVHIFRVVDLHENNKGYLRKAQIHAHVPPQEDEEEKEEISSSRKRKQKTEVSQNRIDHEMCKIRDSDQSGNKRKKVFLSSINGVSMRKRSDIKNAFKVAKKGTMKQGGYDKEEQKKVSQNMINHDMLETQGSDQRGDKKKQVLPYSTNVVSVRKQSNYKIIHKMMKMAMVKQERGCDEEDEVVASNGLHKLQSVVDLRGDKKENFVPSSEDGASMGKKSDDKIAHKMMEKVVVVKQEVASINGSRKLFSHTDHEKGEQRKFALPCKNGVIIGEQSPDKNAPKAKKMGVIKEEQERNGGSLLGWPLSIAVKQKKGQFESPHGRVSIKEEQIEITDHCIGLKEVKKEQGLTNPFTPISELREGPFKFCKDCRLPEYPSQLEYGQNDASISRKLFRSHENATDITKEPPKKKNEVFETGPIDEKEEENMEENEEEKMYYDVQRLISRKKDKNEDLFFLVELTQEVDLSKIGGAVEKEGVAWWVPASYFESGFGRCHL